MGVKEWLMGMRHMFQESQIGLFPDHLTSMEATLCRVEQEGPNVKGVSLFYILFIAMFILLT